MRALLPVALAAFLFLSSIAYAADIGPRETESAWRAVVNYLTWEKTWFGTIAVENCYRRWAGKRVQVTFHLFSPTYYRAPSRWWLKCAADDKESPRVSAMTVRIEDTVLNYDLISAAPEPNGLQRKAVVRLLPSPDLMEPDCRDRGTAQWNAQYRDHGVPSTQEKRLLPRITPRPLPRVGESLQNTVVLQAVQRSMAYFLRRRYFEPAPPGSLQKQWPPELLERVRRSKRLLLGRFSNDDPALLVWYEGDEMVYRLDFPTAEVLADDQVCMVMEDAPAELGFDDAKVQKRLSQRLKRDGIVLELPNWGNPQ